jgi:hypothetical protein
MLECTRMLLSLFLKTTSTTATQTSTIDLTPVRCHFRRTRVATQRDDALVANATLRKRRVYIRMDQNVAVFVELGRDSGLVMYYMGLARPRSGRRARGTCTAARGNRCATRQPSCMLRQLVTYYSVRHFILELFY